MISFFMHPAEHIVVDHHTQPRRSHISSPAALRSNSHSSDAAPAQDAWSESRPTLPADQAASPVVVYNNLNDAHLAGILAKMSAALNQAQHIFIDEACAADLGWATRLMTAFACTNPIAGFSAYQQLSVPATPKPPPSRRPKERELPYPQRSPIQDHAQGQAGGAGGRRPENSARQPQAAAAPGQPPQPLPCADLESPECTMEPQSAFYVERSGDAEALQAMCGQGVTMTIKGSRQAGKTTLLTRLAAEGRRQGKYVLALDLQFFEPAVLGDEDKLFRYFCEAVSIGLGIESRIEAFWGEFGNSYHCTRYFERYLLPQLDAPLVLVIDKIELLPATAARSDFFGMLRAWCHNRAIKPIWNQLDLVLATAVEPEQLTDNPYQSPFNLGLTVDLNDFTLAQISELNERHGRPFAPAQIEALTALVGGHPYLIRRALYLAAVGRYTPEDIIAKAWEDGGPFGDHLRYLLFKLCDQPDLIAALRCIITHSAHPDKQAFAELHSAGLVCREGERALPRCQLYAAYFRERLD